MKEELQAFSSYTIILVIFFSAFTSLAISPHHICNGDFLRLTQKRNLTNCKKLLTLDSAFGWNYYKTDNSGTHLDILFAAKIDGEPEVVWLAWGVNPGKSAEMVGTKAIIGIKQPNLTLAANAYDVTADTKRGCKLLPSPDIGLQVIEKPSMDFEIQTNIYTLYAKVILPSNYNISKLNHLWQVGYRGNDSQPQMHPDTLQHLSSTETIDLTTGHDFQKQTLQRRLTKVHGILSFIGWGTFLPTGVIIARYFRVYPIALPGNRGTLLHALCQIIGYTIGTVAWAIGLYLGHFSKTYIFQMHRLYGIIIFTCATAQVISSALIPKAEDEYRKYWNMYHHIVGYGIIALIIINIFRGIAILNEGPVWKWSYVGLLGLIGLVVLGFEIFTWVRFSVEGKHSQRGGPTPVSVNTNSPAHKELDKPADGAKTTTQENNHNSETRPKQFVN